MYVRLKKRHLKSRQYSDRSSVANYCVSHDHSLQENVFSETPLHAACTGGKSLELIAFLMKQPGVDPNYQGHDGHTGGHYHGY